MRSKPKVASATFEQCLQPKSVRTFAEGPIGHHRSHLPEALRTLVEALLLPGYQIVTWIQSCASFDHAPAQSAPFRASFSLIAYPSDIIFFVAK
jgi:hypothetical protein